MINKKKFIYINLLFITFYFLLYFYIRYHPINNFFMAFIISSLQGIMPILLYWKQYHSLHKLGFIKSNLSLQIIYGIICSIIVLAFVLSVYYFVLNAKISLNTASVPLSLIFLRLFMELVIIAFSEEIFWRGYLLNQLEQLKIPTLLSICISSFLFALAHYIVNGVTNPIKAQLQLFIVPIIGFIFSIFYKKKSNFSIISLTLAHGLYNIYIKYLVIINF